MTSRDCWWFLYRWFDADGTLLYVGITTECSKRERDHRKKSWWTRFATRVAYDPPQLVVKEEAEAWETAAIRGEKPVFNRAKARDPYTAGREYLQRNLVGSELDDAMKMLPAPRPLAPAEGPPQPLVVELAVCARELRERVEDMEWATILLDDAVVAAIAGGVPNDRIVRASGLPLTRIRKIARESAIPLQRVPKG